MNRRNGGRDQMRKQREGAGMLDLVWLRNPQYYRDSKFSSSRLEEYFDPKYKIFLGWENSSFFRPTDILASGFFVFSENPPRKSILYGRQK